jgi:hypothetical protein
MTRLLSFRSAQRRAVHQSPWLEGEFVACYARWRAACAGLRNAYDHWTRVEWDAQPFAFAAYTAALDREERAAAEYRECADRIAQQA